MLFILEFLGTDKARERSFGGSFTSRNAAFNMSSPITSKIFLFHICTTECKIHESVLISLYTF